MSPVPWIPPHSFVYPLCWKGRIWSQKIEASGLSPRPQCVRRRQGDTLDLDLRESAAYVLISTQRPVFSN